MQNTEPNELEVLVDISSKPAETDELDGTKSNSLREKEEEIQGKLVKHKSSFIVPVN
jgi:hypothetical protein